MILDWMFISIFVVPREALESLWDSYNLLGEGWGINVVELGTIISNSPFLTSKLG